MKVRLSQIGEGILPLNREEGEILINGIVSDSRKVTPGDLFVAVMGYKTDGHTYIDQAVKNGAACLVVERPANGTKIPVIQVKNARRALALMSHRWYGDPSQWLSVIGVTGTNGKTTVTFLLDSIFQQAGHPTGVIGTLVYRWGNQERTAERTTPDVVEINELLSCMHRDGVRFVCMEVSSHALSLHRVDGFQFQGAIFTNLSRDHLDFHRTMKSYGRAKARLFEMLKPDGVAVINADDPYAPEMKKHTREKILSYGYKNRKADYAVDVLETSLSGARFSVRGRDVHKVFYTPLVGQYNIMNCTAAAVMAIALGVPEESVEMGIARMTNVPGRMESIKVKDYSIVIDYAHTPQALEKVLEALRPFVKRRIILVFGCGGDRDRGKRPRMGKVACKLADEVIVTSDNPRSEDPSFIIEEIMKPIRKKKKVSVIVDRRDAIHEALERAGEGDAVLVAGKGHENYQEINGKRFPFQDREVCESFLKEKGIHADAR